MRGGAKKRKQETEDEDEEEDEERNQGRMDECVVQQPRVQSVGFDWGLFEHEHEVDPKGKGFCRLDGRPSVLGRNHGALPFCGDDAECQALDSGKEALNQEACGEGKEEVVWMKPRIKRKARSEGGRELSGVGGQGIHDRKVGDPLVRRWGADPVVGGGDPLGGSLGRGEFDPGNQGGREDQAASCV